MHLFIGKLGSIEPRWNVEPLVEGDFYRLCERFSIRVIEAPMSTEGFYFSMLGGHYIAVNSRLTGPLRLVVMFHELAHFLLHAPDAGVAAEFRGLGRRKRRELEADIFAVCAVIPRPYLESRSLQELIEEHGLPPTLVMQRAELLAVMGV